MAPAWPGAVAFARAVAVASSGAGYGAWAPSKEGGGLMGCGSGCGSRFGTRSTMA